MKAQDKIISQYDYKNIQRESLRFSIKTLHRFHKFFNEDEKTTLQCVIPEVMKKIEEQYYE